MIVTHAAQETRDLGAKLAAHLRPGYVVLRRGDLGADDPLMEHRPLPVHIARSALRTDQKSFMLCHYSPSGVTSTS